MHMLRGPLARLISSNQSNYYQKNQEKTDSPRTHRKLAVRSAEYTFKFIPLPL
jgi:hypothetical protein